MTTIADRLLELSGPEPLLTGLGLAERGLLPDTLLRLGIRNLCRDRLRQERAGDWSLRKQSRIDELKQSAIAIETEAANVQHYELPPVFFQRALGKRLKYSSCYYATGRETLDQAEVAMLDLYFERAELKDGQSILELGCGWGSMTLTMAERLPNARIVGVSNSHGQRQYIESECKRRGLQNVRIITNDVNRLELPERQFDRCVSIEMFEHMRNYEQLLGRISRWLKADGKLFVHIFCHQYLCYPFETDGDQDWMARHFFTGGLMPATDTLLWFQKDLQIEAQWQVNGRHYQQTANHWLENQDRHRDDILKLMGDTYGANRAALWHQRWRMFWMACAELFGYRDGTEWLVAHYRFSNRG
ncbi:SAM-dependent methyltransferase [Ahniella affigens]|uniref:SAM-dependent methyltransferase n=1 Tax=Ahniella affigens TaxID=2021234 RepID=A0A2P1PS86_9GAMM|nr:cyclopropane-fatty-acyl-phospholipid synthase family protein [Ahniella affigens]AVP97690.1 SAM-dependent methyltransferase [Ahniella affigens]